jgi:hypothetical protein
MQFFDLLGFQDVMMFLFPTLVFIILLAAGLWRTPMGTRSAAERERKILNVFPGEIGERDSPFPLFLAMVIVGFVLWAVFYTLVTGLLGRRI